MKNVRKHRDIKHVTTNKQKVFSIRTELSHNKMVFWKFFSNRNEQNNSKNE